MAVAAQAASARANTAGSTLPPLSTAPTTCPRASNFPASSAARHTAPPGSTTSLRWQERERDRGQHLRVADREPPASRRAVDREGQLRPASSPAARRTAPSRPARCAAARRRASERPVSSQPSGSTQYSRVSPATRPASASAQPAISPPPPVQTSSASIASPAARASSASSSASVPWPAMTCGWSNGGTRTAPVASAKRAASAPRGRRARGRNGGSSAPQRAVPSCLMRRGVRPA